MEKGAELGLSSESFQVMISEKIGQYGKRSGAWSFLRIISGYDIREDWAVWKKERSLVLPQNHFRLGSKEKGAELGPSSESFQVMISEKIGQYGKRSGAWSFLRIISGYDIREDWAVWKKECIRLCYSALIDIVLNKCFERVTETLKGSLIEAMITLKDILTDAIQCEMEALKNELLFEVKRRKGKKLTVQGSRQRLQMGILRNKLKVYRNRLVKLPKRRTRFLIDSIFMANSNEDSLETSDLQKTSNVSTITRDLVKPVVLNDS
ncbi:hypothetical protein ACOME3_009544 [Neoechinorhynchus agilis]